MSEKTRKLSPLHGLLLAGAAAIALAVACDTRSPTQLNEAIDEVITEGRDVEQAPSAIGDGQPLPLVVVDGKRFSPEDVAPGDDGDIWPYLQALDITRLEIIKGPAAKEIYGDEAAGGVIQIFTTEETPKLKLPFTVEKVDIADIPVPSLNRGSGGDSSFGFEVSLPTPASEWNADLNFRVGMPAPSPEGLGNIVRAMTSGVEGAEITFEGDGSLRGWIQVSPATTYRVAHDIVETIGAGGAAS